MVRVCDLIDDAGELLDNELRELNAFIEKELKRREEQKELEAKKKVVQAIQDYLAAGYTLWIEGEVEVPDEDYNADYQSVMGFVESVDLKDNQVNQVTLNFIEER